MSRRSAGIALAFATACISGVSIWVNGHAVAHFANATVYTTAKNAVAGLLLLLLALTRPSTAAAASYRAAVPRTRLFGLAAVAVVGGSVPFVLFFEGLQRAEATQAAFIQKTLVVWVALLAVPLLKERVRGPHLLAVGLLLAGQAWLAGSAGRVAFGEGEAMILAATLLWAVEVVLVKRLLAAIPSRVLAAARMGLGTALLFGWLAITGRLTVLGAFDAAQWRWVVLTGLLLTAYVATWYAALARAPAVDVTAVLVFGAVITAALSSGADGVAASPVGIGLVTAGALLAGGLGLRRRDAGAGVAP
jgi:drug/metabolite transporter (DMT)-like permease